MRVGPLSNRAPQKSLHTARERAEDAMYTRSVLYCLCGRKSLLRATTSLALLYGEQSAMPHSHPTDQNTSPEAASSWATKWGLLLRMARQVEGLSLSELAARTGLSKGYLSKMESAHPWAANPSRATLAALARALPSTIPLIQHLAPEEGLPTARSLVGEQWNVVVQPVKDLPLPLAPQQPIAPGQPGEAKSVGLAESWMEWEVLLTLVVVEGAGFGPPTQAVLEHACKVEAPLTTLLEALEQRGGIRKIPPAQVGGPARYTVEGTQLADAAIQRPAQLFMQAAMNLLLGAGIHKDDQRPASPGRSPHNEYPVR
jgi:transcriptional regulator with XRE-family HTH domain